MGSITLELVFPNPLVSFVTVRGSLVSEMVGAQITSEVRVSSEDESKSELQVALFTPESGSQMAIPDGLLGFITFQLSQDAQLDTHIVLSSKGSARTTGPSPKPVEPLTVHGGEISLGEIIFACFFYLH